MEDLKQVSGEIYAQLRAPKIVSKILCCVALVYDSYFFSELPFCVNYSTLDAHANTVISSAVAYLARWLPKP